MRERNVGLLLGVIILALVAIWVNWPTNPGLHIHLGPINFDRDIRVHQGLDLQGGMQVLLEADLPEGEEIDPGAMEAVKVIVKNRVDALGVTPDSEVLHGARASVVLPAELVARSAAGMTCPARKIWSCILEVSTEPKSLEFLSGRLARRGCLICRAHRPTSHGRRLLVRLDGS